MEVRPVGGTSGKHASGSSHVDKVIDELLADDAGGSPLLPQREPVGARLASLMGRRHWLLLPLCIILLWTAMIVRPPGENTDLRAGQVAPRDILAPHAATLLDRELTRRNREAAADLVPPEYDGRPGAQDQALADLHVVLAAFQRALPLQNPPSPNLNSLAERTRRLNSTLSNRLPESLVQKALQVPRARWNAVERATEVAVRAVYVRAGAVQQIRSDVNDDLKAARLRMDEALRQRRTSMRLTDSEFLVAQELAQHVARYPNLVVNEDKTARARLRARGLVPEVYRNILPGTVLVEAGARLDEQRWAELQDLDLVAPRFNATIALARFVLCILVVCFAAAYLSRFHPRLIEKPTALWLASMLPVIFVVAFRYLLRVPHGDQLMVPLVAVSAMLLTILLDTRVGVMCAFVVASLCALMARAEGNLLMATMLSSLIGVLAVSEISSRFQLVRASLILAATNAALVLSFGWLRDMPTEEMFSSAIWGALAGAVAVGMTAGLAMFLERPFGITTHLRLLELSAPDELVLRRMQAESPGTYTHSLMVSLLSETAAKAVDADPLLCRVGGLYHDIGKLRRPHCFVENQSGDNVHDRLAPQLSALLIIAHVKDGVDLGRAMRLPQPVQDIIVQHHGTSLLSYFYSRAVQQAREAVRENAAEGGEGEGEVKMPDEAPYRYPGPRPQSKEAAIVMLADTIEASSRALPNLTPERLTEHIKAMLEQRLREGELSECDLTLRDLKTIENTFAHVLRGVLHQRIEYPDPSHEFNETKRNWTDDALSDRRDHDRAETGEGERGGTRFPYLPGLGELRQNERGNSERRYNSSERAQSAREEKPSSRSSRRHSRQENRRREQLAAATKNETSEKTQDGATEIAHGIHRADTNSVREVVSSLINPIAQDQNAGPQTGGQSNAPATYNGGLEPGGTQSAQGNGSGQRNGAGSSPGSQNAVPETEKHNGSGQTLNGFDTHQLEHGGEKLGGGLPSTRTDSASTSGKGGTR